METNEQQRLYNLEIIHTSSRGLCGKCQKILWTDCSKRYYRKTEKADDGYLTTADCDGFDPIVEPL